MQSFRLLPNPPVQKKKDKRKPNRKALWMLSLFFTAILVVVYIRSPLSKLQVVTVDGNHQINSAVIQQKSGLTLQMNVWKIRTSQVEKQLLAEFPLFSTVQVKYQFPSTVLIHVQEKQTSALFMSQGKFYHMLNDGTLLDEVPATYGSNLPIVTTSNPVTVKIGSPVSDPEVIALAGELTRIPPARLNFFSDIEVMSGGQWIAYTLDGFEVKFISGHLADKLALFDNFHKQLLNQGYKPGIINMMDPPVYSAYPKNQPATQSAGQDKKGAS